jgi:hypothetical protein
MKWLYLSAVLCLSGFAAFAQIEKKFVLRDLKKIRNGLESIGTNDNLALKEDVAQCRQTLNDAIVEVESNPAKYTPEFLSALDRLASFQKEISMATGVAKVQMLDILKRDLNAKFGSTGGNMSSTVFSQMATTNIVTRNDKGEIKNLRIHYAALGYSIDFSKEYKTFPKLTSPSSMDLVPGYYLFWVTKENQKTVLAQIHQEVMPGRTNPIELMVTVE